MADTPKIMDLTPPDIQTDGPVRIDGRWEAMPAGTYAALQKRIRKLERRTELLDGETFHIDPPLPFEPIDIQDLQHREYRDWPDFEIDAGDTPSPRRSTEYGYA